MRSVCPARGSACRIVWSRASIADQEPAGPEARGRRVRVLDLLVIKPEALNHISDAYIKAIPPGVTPTALHTSIVASLENELVLSGVTYHYLTIDHPAMELVVEGDA